MHNRELLELLCLCDSESSVDLSLWNAVQVLALA